MKNELVLENYGVQEMQAVEKQEVDGGGPISDWVADVVNYMKCDCNNKWYMSPMNRPRPYRFQ